MGQPRIPASWLVFIIDLTLCTFSWLRVSFRIAIGHPSLLWYQWKRPASTPTSRDPKGGLYWAMAVLEERSSFNYQKASACSPSQVHKTLLLVRWWLVCVCIYICVCDCSKKIAVNWMELKKEPFLDGVTALTLWPLAAMLCESICPKTLSGLLGEVTPPSCSENLPSRKVWRLLRYSEAVAGLNN